MMILRKIYNTFQRQKRLFTSRAVLLDLLEKKVLLKQGAKEIQAAKALENKNIIVYYFTASWCNPCKQLLPKLKKVYEESSEKAGLVVIFISSDESEAEMLAYFKERHGNWYAIPFKDRATELMKRNHEVTHIPRIIVVKSDGSLISLNGVKDLDTLGVEVLVAWHASGNQGN